MAQFYRWQHLYLGTLMGITGHLLDPRRGHIPLDPPEAQELAQFYIWQNSGDSGASFVSACGSRSAEPTRRSDAGDKSTFGNSQWLAGHRLNPRGAHAPLDSPGAHIVATVLPLAAPRE